MPDLDNQRFYPASPDETFAALQAAVHHLFKVRGADEFSKSVTFTTPMSGFSWGANLSAQVIPVQGGAYVRVSGSARVATNITARGAEQRNTTSLLDAVSAFIQQQRAQPEATMSSPKAAWYPDTERPGGLRWWDGSQWTEHRHDPKAPPEH